MRLRNQGAGQPQNQQPTLKDPPFLRVELGCQEPFAGNLEQVHLEGGVCKHYEGDLTLPGKMVDFFMVLMPCIQQCKSKQNSWASCSRG